MYLENLMKEASHNNKSVACTFACMAIRFYQVALSPLLSTLIGGGNCRFEPTCSQYGLIAFQRYPFMKALKLTAKRLSKCRPGGPHGYDPVP